MNETEQERQARAEEELEEKLRMEKPVAAQFRRLLRDMSEDLGNVYAATGTVISAATYRDDIIGILRPAYRKASRFFGTQAEQELRQNADNPEHSTLLRVFDQLARESGREISEVIEDYEVTKNDRIVQFNNETVPSRADLITQTNQRELNNAISNATAELAATGAAFTGVQVGRLAARNFRDSSLWRGATIAATEIQNAAEGSKQIEERALQDTIRPVSNRNFGTIQAVKEWRTQGDERVRPAHREADFQRRRLSEPFEVGGELLMYPGDTSLGASAGNTINCRCVSVPFIDGSLPD